MCKGLAISINKEMNIICKGLSSHDRTKSGMKPRESDEYLDFEVMLPKYGRGKVDLGDEVCINHFQELGLLTKSNKPKAKYQKAIDAWLKQNEHQVLKWFVENPELHSYQTIKGNQYQIRQTIKGNQYQNDQTIKGYQYQRRQTIKGNQDQFRQTIKGYQYQSEQTIKGDQYQSEQTIKGNQYQNDQTIKGYQYQRRQTIKGKWFIKNTTNGTKFTQDLMNEWSKQCKEGTFDEYTKWVFKKAKELRE